MARYRGAHAQQKNRRSSRLGAALLIAALLVAALAGGGWALKKFVLDPRGGFPAFRHGTSSVAEPSAAPTLAPTPTPTPKPTPTPSPTPTPAPTPPPIPDDGSDGYMSQGLYIWDNKAFELFYGSTEAAQTYAEAISSYAGQLPGIRVYDMVAPNHSEFGLPERIREDMGCISQRKNLSDVYQSLSAGVTPVDIYDNLNLHNDQYLYFNTDTHWAPLGAFYAYEAFCEAAGVEAHPLTDFTCTTVEGFTGYLAWLTGEDCLYENPDHIDLYVPSCSFTPSVSYDGYSFEELESLHGSDPDDGYSMVIYGDTPLFRIVNHDGATGRRLAVVKDSYGNALAPFLIPNFDQVHVVDFRSFPRNLPAYCEENGITDLLFFNNVMSANTYSQIETMNGLFF